MQVVLRASFVLLAALLWSSASTAIPESDALVAIPGSVALDLGTAAPPAATHTATDLESSLFLRGGDRYSITVPTRVLVVGLPAAPQPSKVWTAVPVPALASVSAVSVVFAAFLLVRPRLGRT